LSLQAGLYCLDQVVGLDACRFNGRRRLSAQFLQIVNEPLQPIGFTVDLLVSVLIRREHAVDQAFHVPFDTGQRCAQFVDNVAEELAAHCFGLLQTHGHLIETHRQSVQFVGRRRVCHAHALVVVTVGNASAGEHHRAHRRDDLAANECATTTAITKRPALTTQCLADGSTKVVE
jgi:hypothetical protein